MIHYITHKQAKQLAPNCEVCKQGNMIAAHWRNTPVWLAHDGEDYYINVAKNIEPGLDWQPSCGMWACQATVTKHDRYQVPGDGTRHITKQVPTFYLHPEVNAGNETDAKVYAISIIDPFQQYDVSVTPILVTVASVAQQRHPFPQHCEVRNTGCTEQGPPNS